MKQILLKMTRLFPTTWLETLIYYLAVSRAKILPADEALRFLFRLDAALYPWQGRLATEYGGGVHTKHCHMRYHDFFVGHVHPEEKVLDIGCGIGAVAYDVAERARAHVIGIDRNTDHIARARRRFSHPRVTYLIGDVLQDLPADHFDVVILSNVLEHLPKRSQFLRRIQATMQPNRFLIRVPLFERDWRVPLKRELNVEWRLDREHEIEYTLESFAEEMAAAGLKITYQEVRWSEIWAEVKADSDNRTGAADGAGGVGGVPPLLSPRHTLDNNP